MVSSKRRASSILPALVRFLIIASVVGLVLFYGAGGWYFAGQLEGEVLEVSAHEDGPDVSVTDRTFETILLDAVDDPEVSTDGWFGVTWDDGGGLVGPVVQIVGPDVEREFVAGYGEAIEVGGTVDFDPWVWTDPENGLGLDFEEVTYQAALGTFDAWRVPGDDEWFIAVHGKGAERREMLRLASIAADTGMTALLIDYRNDPGAPADPSGQYQYGVTEWEDLEGAVQYALDEGATRVVLAGASTGAAIAMSFLYQSELAGEIDQVVFDAPNIDMEATVRLGASQRELPILGYALPDSLATAAMWFAERRYDIDFDDWDYIARADELDVPILVLHGVLDDTVPVSVSEALAAARPDLVTFHSFAAAEHVESWNSERDRYVDLVSAFLEPAS